MDHNYLDIPDILLSNDQDNSVVVVGVMINIIIDQEHDEIQVEGFVFEHAGSSIQLARIGDLIKHILNKAYYGGETLCLEIRDNKGNYIEIDRWK